MKRKQLLWIAAGTLFSVFWASASTATKVSLEVAQPLVIAITRFSVAALIMLFYSHAIKKYRLPTGKEWTGIAIYGLLNITIYLGCYVIAMQEVTASIGAIATATNPVFISVISVLFLRKKLGWNIVLSLIICMAGVICAAWPLLGYASVTLKGLLILLFSMISYSLGAIYVSSQKWNNLSLITINGWQTLIGGIFLFPVGLYYYQPALNNLNYNFWSGVLWLAIPVSIFAAQLWLWLLKIDAIRAGFWLFLCPLFGALIAAIIVNESITGYTIIGILLVVTGLFFAKKSSIDRKKIN